MGLTLNMFDFSGKCYTRYYIDLVLKELAAQIKAEIQECRKVKEMHVKSHPPTDKMKLTKEKNTEEVLLTMTDRYGNVRPIPAREHDDSGGRQRKQKV